MPTLDINHRLVLRGDAYVVIENFGDQPAIEFAVADQPAGMALIAERKAMLKEMVASISPEARRAVEDAREIDRLKAGHA